MFNSVRWTSSIFGWVTGHWRLVFIAMFILFPFWGYCARGALKTTSDDPRQWLPSGFAETDVYDRFQQQFGIDEIAVASWPGCRLGEPSLDQAISALMATGLFRDVLSGETVLRDLVDGGNGVPPAIALQRLAGTLVGPDGRTTCLVMMVAPAATENRLQTVTSIRRVLLDLLRITPEDLKLAGPTVDAAAIDAESRRMLFQLAGLSAVLSLAIAAFQLRSFRYALIVLFIAIYCTAASLSVVYLCGGRMNLLMTMLPPLIYILSTATAVHLVNYYRDAAKELSHDCPALAAATQAWQPCFVSTLTTAIGFASLGTSRIDSIAAFGYYAAAGVSVSLGLIFIFMPAAFAAFGRVRGLEKRLADNACNSPSTINHRSNGDRSRDVSDEELERSSRREKFITQVIRHHQTISIAGLLLMLIVGSGLGLLESTVRLQSRFLPDHKLIRDYEWLEQNIGPMVPMEVLVSFKIDDPQPMHRRVQVVGEIQASLQLMRERLSSLSAVDFVAPIPSGNGVTQVAMRRALSSRLEGSLERLKATHFLAETNDEQIWRISLRAAAMGQLDYGILMDKIRQVSSPFAKDNVDIVYTGVIPLIYKAQRQLLEDLIVSFLTAFLVIALVFVFLLRSFWGAVLVMVPNLFPVVIVFGAMGCAGISLQIGSIMTASAALGIAVDDTIHFVTWFRRGVNRGLSTQHAIMDAFHGCSGAMMQTTMIGVGGLIVFAVSTFVPVLHFAYLMSLLLAIALVGDLVLLPALLAGWGRTLFQRSNVNNLPNQLGNEIQSLRRH